MPFQVGDVVVHPDHGVGHIVRLEEKRFSGKEACLYYELTIERSTIWVPVESHQALRLRKVTPKSDLARYRSVLKSRPTQLNKDQRQRHLEIAARLKQGTFLVLCEVVRDLTARGWQKPLNEIDAASLQKVRGRLCQEWAASESVSIAEATGEVTSLLLEARKGGVE
jgi:RNA polymerase-interacting CarD/CdnL/TRCF family regulator